MIVAMKDLPQNVAGFRAIGEVTKQDYEDVLVPGVEKLVENIDKINFLFVLDTSVKDFTLGAWFQDAMLGIKNITKWHRAAIVSDSEAVRTFTNAFSVLIPGEFKGFPKAKLQEAVEWTAAS